MSDTAERLVRLEDATTRAVVAGAIYTEEGRPLPHHSSILDPASVQFRQVFEAGFHHRDIISEHPPLERFEQDAIEIGYQHGVKIVNAYRRVAQQEANTKFRRVVSIISGVAATAMGGAASVLNVSQGDMENLVYSATATVTIGVVTVIIPAYFRKPLARLEMRRASKEQKIYRLLGIETVTSEQSNGLSTEPGNPATAMT